MQAVVGGGFPEVSDENPAGQVLVYIASDDIDADLKNVKELGGKVLREKMKIQAWVGSVSFRSNRQRACGLHQRETRSTIGGAEMDATFLALHRTRQAGCSIEKTKYDLMRSAILDVLKTAVPSVS